MENLHQLSDEQLIGLFQNNKIDSELKSQLIAEIDRRDLKKEVPEIKPLDFKTKMTILATSAFGFRYHVRQSNTLLANGKTKQYKQYWNYFTLGLGINIFLFLLLAKYVIKPYVMP